MGNEATNVKSFYKGQSIYKEGQAGTAAFLIQKGSVSLYKTQDNKKQMFARLGKGDIFGEMGALTGSVRTETAEAAEYCDIMVLSKQLIHNLLAKSPKTVKQLVSLLATKVRAGQRFAQSSRTHKNTFLAVCRLLEMAHRNHRQTPRADAAKIQNHALGLRWSDFLRACKDVLLVSQLEVDQVLEKLANLKIITMQARTVGKAFSEKFIKIPDEQNFLQVAANLQKELHEAGKDDCELQYIDILDFAEAIDADPQILYKKISQGELPESLFFFDSKHSLQWAKSKGEDFFKKVTRKRKKPEDLEDVDDIVFVDKATLQSVFSSLGYYKVGVLLAVAQEDARKKILGALSKKIAAIVEEEAKGREQVDTDEAQDIQDELISLIQSAKGVKAS